MLTILKKNLNLIVLVVIVVTFVVSYFRVPFIFFQQDEFLGFGLFISQGPSVILRGLGATSIAHFVPLTMSLSYTLYTVFGMKYWLFNSLGLMFHLVNGVFVYLIARKLLAKKLSALLAVLIFFSSAQASELIMWPVINLNSIALTFSLAAWLLLLTQSVRNSVKSIVLPLLFLAAVFSVEYAAGLVLFIPLVVFLRNIAGTKKQNFLLLLPFLVVVCGYFLLRFLPIVLAPKLPALSVPGGPNLIVRTFDLVPKYVGQIFLGQSASLAIAGLAAKVLGRSVLGESYVENSVFPAVTTVAGIGIIGLLLLIYRESLKLKKVSYARSFLSAAAFVLFSSLPFVLVPNEVKPFSVIASRYMYFGLAGMALVIAFINELFISQKKIFWSCLVLLTTLALIVGGVVENYQKAELLYLRGNLRLQILEDIRKSYPDLPQRVVFYTRSDTSYYGLPEEEKILPFQSGLGQTLLIWYYQSGQVPQDFFKDRFLWEITSQGYKEVAGRGFGYFRNLDLLRETVKKYNLPMNSVIAFSWDSSTNFLTDITPEIQKDLSKNPFMNSFTKR